MIKKALSVLCFLLILSCKLKENDSITKLDGIVKIEIFNKGYKGLGDLSEKTIIVDEVQIKEIINAFDSMKPFEGVSGSNYGYIRCNFIDKNGIVLSVDNVYNIYNGVISVTQDKEGTIINRFTGNEFVFIIEEQLYTGEKEEDLKKRIENNLQ